MTRLIPLALILTAALTLIGCVSGTGGTTPPPPPPPGVVDAVSGLVSSIPNPLISGAVGAGLLWLGQIIWPGSILVPSQVKAGATAPKPPTP